MVPMKYSSIFKSRWMALLWSAGIIWFALDVAGDPPKDNQVNAAATTDATGAPVDAAQANQLAAIIDAP